MRAFHVTWRRTRRGMAQAVAHRDKLADRSVQLVGLGGKLPPVDTRPSVRREHPGNFIEREARRAPQCDQRQADSSTSEIEQPAQAPPADGGNQPLFLIKLQRRRRNTGALCDFGDIDRHFTPLDLKFT